MAEAHTTFQSKAFALFKSARKGWTEKNLLFTKATLANLGQALHPSLPVFAVQLGPARTPEHGLIFDGPQERNIKLRHGLSKLSSSQGALGSQKAFS